MKISNNSKLNSKDLVLFVAIILITIAAFFCTFYFAMPSTIKVIVWIFWFIASALLMYFTHLGKNTIKFINEAKIELFKIVWPTRQETIQTTSIVMIMVAITGFVLWAVDSAMIWAVAKITHLG